MFRSKQLATNLRGKRSLPAGTSVTFSLFVIVVDVSAKSKICVVLFTNISDIFSAFATTVVFALLSFVLREFLHKRWIEVSLYIRCKKKKKADILNDRNVTNT